MKNNYKIKKLIGENTIIFGYMNKINNINNEIICLYLGHTFKFSSKTIIKMFYKTQIAKQIILQRGKHLYFLIRHHRLKLVTLRSYKEKKL